MHNMATHVQGERDADPELVQQHLEECVHITEDPEGSKVIQRRLLEADNDEAKTFLGLQTSGGHKLGEKEAWTGTEAGSQGQHQVCVPPNGLGSLQKITSRPVPPLENWVAGVKPGSTETNKALLCRGIFSGSLNQLII